MRRADHSIYVYYNNILSHSPTNRTQRNSWNIT